MDYKNADQQKRWCATRREFLLFGGGIAATVLFVDLLGVAEAVPVKVASYPRRRIGRVSQLKPDVPLEFKYPHEDPNSTCLLVKLGVPAGGGVGPEKDIVAFSALCTHQGGPLWEQYQPQYKAIGPCPIHLSSFDLVRHGLLIQGSATESLPQVVLEVKGDEIYATGVMGLIYGYHNNLG